MTELSSRFNFKDIDDKWSRYWEDNNCFHAKANNNKKPYTIMIPPPNVTGILHMGHALNNTLQDIIMRTKRMQGYEALWMPGTDHAGIATQNVVEKQLAKEGKTRQDIGREALLKRLWAWKKDHGDTIIHQLKKLGSSCDWSRTRFTMDDDYCTAVQEVFIHLYNKDLIYRGQRIINWCPRCLTALSDEEAEHHDTKGHLYHLRYPLRNNPKKFLIVATTRPETMLGDMAVAVNPADERYQDLIGQYIILPLVNREIPIIADDFVDMSFGTGAVKVTPAHDPNDFNMGQRHNLECLNIMNPDASLNAAAGVDFKEMDRFEAREAIIETLRIQELLVKIDEHDHAVGHCYRCHTVVEPYLSKQWFVKMEPLAAPAIKVVEEGKINFYPDRWTKVYMNWLTNIRDWCISRQIWWGHRIPAWYCTDCPPDNNVIVQKDTPNSCPRCQSTNLTQEEDVLDTWFSSWLWPFATLGWPKTNDDLKYFYPGSSLFTAPEIIFFWVARMIMAGLELMGDIPFKDVYLHGTVRDAQGRKMSKSLGNALDPLEIIEEYGADALRFSLIMNSGQDLFISKEKFEVGRNFANKIWNAARLVLMRASSVNTTMTLETVDPASLDLASRWIISRATTTLKKVEEAIEKFRYSEAESLLYEFFWGNYCDWYLEIIKNRWNETTVQTVAVEVLKLSILMLHPFIPFVTEELWHHMPGTKGDCCHQPWPTPQTRLQDTVTETDMDLLIQLIGSIRNLRAQWKIKPKDKITCHVASNDDAALKFLNQHQAMVQKLGSLSELHLASALPKLTNTAKDVVGALNICLPLGDLIDVAQEQQRLTIHITQQRKAHNNLAKRLNNEAFLSKAPQNVVAKEQERLADLKRQIGALETILNSLQ